MKRKRENNGQNNVKTIHNIQNQYNHIVKYLNARSLARVRTASKAHGLSKAAANETNRRAADIAEVFGPWVRGTEVFIHEIAVMLKRTRYTNPQTLKQAIAARSRAHPDVVTRLEVNYFENNERSLNINVSPNVTYPKGRIDLAVNFSITFQSNNRAVMPTEFRLHVDIPSCKVMLPMRLDRASAAATARTMASMRPTVMPHVTVVVLKLFPYFANTPGLREHLSPAHLVARYAFLGEEVWGRPTGVNNDRIEAMRRISMLADDQGPVVFPIMLEAIARMFNRRVADGIVRALHSTVNRYARTARELIQAQRAFTVFQHGFVTRGIREVYNRLRAHAETGRPQILSSAEIASLSPKLQKKIARLRTKA